MKVEVFIADMPRLIDLIQNHRKSQLVTAKAHGGPIDIQGISIATVDDQARIQKIETWFDPLEMFRQIAPDGIVTKEKIITQLDGSEAPVSKNESSQGGQDSISSEEAANEKQHQVTTVIETPRPAVEALDETNNLESVEESVGMTEKVNSVVETDTAANLIQQPSTDQLNPPDQQFSTEPSSSLLSEPKNVIAIATTTEPAELPASDEPNRKVYEENLATKSVPEPSQPPTPTIHSKTEFLVQPSESGASIITPSNDANDKNTQAELISYLDDKDPRQQQQEVDRSGQTPSPTILILPEREEAKPEQPSSETIPSALEERLRKLEARLAKLEFMERIVVDSGESGNGTGAGTLGNAGIATLGEVKKEGEDRKKEDRIRVKTDAHDVEEEEKEKSRTATKIIGNEFSPSAAAVAGAGCPFLNRG